MSRRPPEDAINHEARRAPDGTIVVGEDQLTQLVNAVDWSNLSPFEKYVLLVLDENGLLPDE